MMIRRIAKLFGYAIAGWLPGGQRQCLLCGHAVWRFMPYRRGVRSVQPLSRLLSVIGSDVVNFACPRCWAHDRERHLLLYLRASHLLDEIKGKAVLHFAPERHLRTVIEAANPATYVKADLFPTSVDVRRVDMLAMPFDDQSFDFLIANHVLEHVTDDRRALAEIRRVLRIGGYAILQTPYSPRLTRTWQDDGIDTDDARLVAFGQEDHVRLYGRDIFERFASAGLRSLVTRHEELLPDVDAARFGINVLEPFFLFRRSD